MKNIIMSPTIKRVQLTLIGLVIVGKIIAQWTVVSVPSNNNLNAIALSDSSSGWIVGNRGTILQLNNNLWTLYPSVADENLLSICLVSETEGWAVGARGAILHMKDSQWEKVSSPTKYNLHSVCFSSKDNGYAVGDNGTFLIYRNGMWESASLKSPWHFYGLALYDNHPLIAGGRESVIVPIMSVSIDGSHKFTEIHNPGYIGITGIVTTDKNDIWAVGHRGLILHKTDYGWKNVSPSYKLPSFTNVFFSEKDKGIITGLYGTIMTYSGREWQKEVSPVKTKLNAGVIAGNTYYIVGNSGTLLKSDRNPLPPSSKIILPDKPLLIAPYPNPASGILTIEVPESVTSRNTIYIINSAGQIVYAKELGGGFEGRTEQLNIQQLGNGSYLVNILSEERTVATGKFIIKN